jgi:hypothetical protein
VVLTSGIKTQGKGVDQVVAEVSGIESGNYPRGFLETMHTKGKAVARCRQGWCKQGQGRRDQDGIEDGIEGNQADLRSGGAGHCRR